jgi:hypothetical protein
MSKLTRKCWLRRRGRDKQLASTGTLLLKTPICLMVGGDLLCREGGMDLAARMKEIQPHIAVVVRSRILPSSMRGVDFFISAAEPWLNFLNIVKDSIK